MTARKPKPRKAVVRKGSKATMGERMERVEAFCGAHTGAINQLHQRVSDLERLADWNSDCITVLRNELEALQTRKQFRDASHDAPVSNAGEAVGQHFRIVGELHHVRWWHKLVFPLWGFWI